MPAILCLALTLTATPKGATKMGNKVTQSAMGKTGVMWYFNFFAHIYVVTHFEVAGT